MWRRICIAVLAGAMGSTMADTGVSDRHPVYVGVDACSQCHASADAGHTFSVWRTSPHAGAYASLWSEDAKRIARLSGIPEEPQEAAVCLGCHATASSAEEWEREEGFTYGDGVQCEKCHGPGSEYMPLQVMMDRDRAMDAGLRMPTKQDCMKCHSEKGSHVAVLSKPAFDIDKAWERIAHPQPADSAAMPKPAPLPGRVNGEVAPHKFAGADNCARCHGGPTSGYQFSRWRESHHARAYAVLGTKAGYETARAEGVEGNPQQNEKCLSCHTTGARFHRDSFAKSFDVRDGVSCEACHGPGGDYHPEAVMRDPVAAKRAGLLKVTRETCMRCHENAHGRTFDFEVAWKKVLHPSDLPPQAAVPCYKTPLNMAVSPDGRELYLACEASDSVIVVDTAARRKVAEIAVGGQPNDVTFSPDGRVAYVTNRLSDSFSVIDTATRTVMREIPVGDEPHGVLTDRGGKVIYVLNTSSDDISVIDAETLAEVKRLTASRSPWSLALSPPDGEVIAVTNVLSRFVPFRTPSMSEITIINTAQGFVEDRIVVPGANLVQGIDWHPSGDFALVTMNRTKNLVPMTRLQQGWTKTNGLGIIWRDGRVDQVLLDWPNLCFPDPADIAISPDGRWAFATSSGSDRVGVIDVEKLLSIVTSADDQTRQAVLPNHLGVPTEFVVTHIPVKNSPRGVVFAPDGKLAYVANALDDSVTVIDVNKLEAVGEIDLGGPEEITRVRFGERLFHSADITFQRQFSCHTCHPDGHIEGLTYDIEPDGIGVAPVDNRTLRGILDTAPFKWEGTNPSLQRQCGPRLAVFFTRIDPFTPEELGALDNYICTIPRPPNRYRPVGGELTPAQRRGKAVFERTHRNDGSVIPMEQRCVTCHFPPLYTDRSRRDVGTKMWLDEESRFDVPHLSNIYDSAPYLHNGIAPTLEEIWTTYNPYDQHGATNDMTKDQLNDLIEYLKTL